MLPEHTRKPAWDIDLRESIYEHLRMAWRLKDRNPDDALWHLNEAVSMLYVAECPSESGGRHVI
jgi:hypothetical protein